MIATKKVRDMSPEELKAYRHALYVANPAASKKRTYAWRTAHPEQYQEKTRRNNALAVTSGKAKTACKVWRAGHPEYQESMRETNRIRCEEWRKANPDAYRKWYEENYDRVAELIWQYRAREAGADGSFTKEQFRALGEQCLRCGRKDVPMTADHVLPLSKGGSNDISNIQPLCGPCNSSKRDKHIDYRDRYYGA